ncbi:unnamed protein product [Owenia fusiformis]|nr:unnamed protein product [Owenia fusiformis]
MQRSKGALARSRSIDHQLDEERELRQKEIQLLILGGASSGKSTFIKQLRIHHGDGFPSRERATLRPHVHENIVEGIHTVTEHLPQFNITLQSPSTQNYLIEFKKKLPRINHFHHPVHENGSDGSPILERPASPVSPMVPRVKEMPNSMIEIIRDSGFQKCLAEHKTFERQLTVAEKHFLDNIERVVSKGYIPTLQDILYIRKPTTGVQEHTFHVNGLNYRVIDVAGQRSQRKKWIHFFDGVTAVIFFASLSGFNEALEEEHSINNLRDSLITFQDLSTNSFLEKTDFILFLNKEDLFKEKMQTVQLKDTFSEFKGENTPEAGLSFIKQEFMRLKRSSKQVYTHVTTATNMDVMKTIIRDVLQIIVEINLKKTTVF